MASSNTGTIVAVSVVGVGVLGVAIYLAMKSKAPTTTTTTTPIRPLVPSGYPSNYAPSNYSPYNNQGQGGYVPQQPASKDSWWQNPLGQVGGNLANKLVNSLFSKGSSSGSDLAGGGSDLSGGGSYDASTTSALTDLYGFSGVPYGK